MFLTTYLCLQEISRWEELYSARSYCNYTYIEEDAIAAAISIQKVVVDRAAKIFHQVVNLTTKVAEPYAAKMRKLYNIHVQPQVDKTLTHYQVHMEPHVQNYILPFHKQYLAPFVTKLGVLVDKIVVEGKSLASRGHSHLVTTYQSTCPKALERLSIMDAPPFLVYHLRISCQDAIKTVNAFFWICLVVLTLIYRNFLLMGVIGIVLCPFRIMWFFSPLRLLFGKEKQSLDAEENGTLAKK